MGKRKSKRSAPACGEPSCCVVQWRAGHGETKAYKPRECLPLHTGELILPLALTLMASSNSITSQITTSSYYQCILTSTFGPLMYIKELCKFRWRIVWYPCLTCTRLWAPPSTAANAYELLGSVFKPLHSLQPPSAATHKQGKRGPEPQGPVPAQSYILVCHMSVVVTS